MSDESKRKLIGIGAHGVTCELVAHSLVEDLPQMQQIFAMVLTIEGGWRLYTSGNAYEMCTAGAILQDSALAVIRDENR